MSFFFNQQTDPHRILRIILDIQGALCGFHLDPNHSLFPQERRSALLFLVEPWQGGEKTLQEKKPKMHTNIHPSFVRLRVQSKKQRSVRINRDTITTTKLLLILFIIYKKKNIQQDQDQDLLYLEWMQNSLQIQ
jgi:hypothetical protein